MAKMYLTEEEAAEKLGVSTEGLENLVQGGKLKVYQDGPRKMYKTQEIEELMQQTDAGEGQEEEDADEIELSPVGPDTTVDAISLSAADSVAAADGKEDTVITAEGISIFDDEDLEIEDADPMAKTQIAPSLEDQIALEGVGSGSGLLDLTRESDDTSLGAEVLDNIDVDSVVGGDAIPEPEPYVPQAPTPAEAPEVVEAIDSSAGAFSGITVVVAILALLVGMVSLAAMRGLVPGMVAGLHENLAIVLGAAAVAILIAALIGYFVGKSIADKKLAMRRMGN
jgi:hypothetical protein